RRAAGGRRGAGGAHGLGALPRVAGGGPCALALFLRHARRTARRPLLVGTAVREFLPDASVASRVGCCCAVTGAAGHTLEGVASGEPQSAWQGSRDVGGIGYDRWYKHS